MSETTLLGLAELVLVVGGLWLFYRSQMRAVRKTRRDDADDAG